MQQQTWWTSIDESELHRLRVRLLEWVRARFGATPGLESEDIVQRAFVILFRDREKIRAENDGLYRYMRIVARNHALDCLKSAQNRLVTSMNNHPDSFIFPVSAENIEESEAVRDFFCKLDELDRLVLWSHVVDGRPVRAIALELGMNWHQAARIIDRSLRRLREHLAPIERIR